VTAPEPSLEQRLTRIEAIVARLESDRIELEEAMALFEEGVAHLRDVDRILHQAELRIERLIAGPGGTVISEPLPEGAAGDAAEPGPV
jgi:exodeoxyribonuclease VII small subunit